MNYADVRAVAAGDDLQPIARLFDAYRVFYRQASDLAAAQAFLAARLQNGQSKLFVAERGGEAIGLVQLYPLFSSTRMQALWLLNDLFVDEAHRGNGVSLALLEAAKQLCRDSDACAVLLETEKSNRIGNALYPRAGFQLDTEHHYYEWDRD